MRTLALLIAFAATLAGCATPTDDAAPTTPERDTARSPTPSGGANVVHSVQDADGNFFDPPTLTVSVGSTVTWDVVGEGHHTVDFLQPINAAGETPKSGDIGPGQTFGTTFSEPGSYKYYCKYHSNRQSGMIGTIVVE